MKPSRKEITKMLQAFGEGDEEVLNQLVPLVYQELKQLAHGRLRDERPQHTLNTTGLVHQAYLKLIDIKHVNYESRGHFFAIASQTMRRVLIDYARIRNAEKRGAGAHKAELKESRLMPEAYAETLLELDDALQRLEAVHPRQAKAVEHRYFGGLSNEETAEALGISTPTVERDLRCARAWLNLQWKEG